MRNPIRNFFALALFATCVLLSANLWAQDAPPATPAPAAASDQDPVLAQVEPLIDKLLAAYNAGDWKAFYADYGKNMASICTEQAFKTMYVDMYMAQFGKYESRTFVKEASSIPADAPVGLLTFKGVFEKEKTVKISINITKEGEAWKIMQVQFAKE